MRVRSTVLLAAGTLLVVGLPAGTATAAAPTDTIHVSKTCASGADGSEQAPYCSIAAAAAVVQPGQTIFVGPGNYQESVSLPSGEPGKPVTVKGYRGPLGQVAVQPGGVQTPLVLSGAHDIVIDTIRLSGTTKSAAVIENSSDITVTNGSVAAAYAPGIDIKGASRRVTVSGTAAAVRGSFVSVGSGVTDTLITGNSVQEASAYQMPNAAAITVVDAPRTTVTSNTIVTDCLVGVAVSGESAGFALHNTIVRTRFLGALSCGESSPNSAGTPAITVDGAAAADGRFDYNIVDPLAGVPAYSWSGTSYPAPAELNAATGQGAHDIRGDAQLSTANPQLDGYSLMPGSPAIDSAWVDAPGQPKTDLRGNAHADKPDRPNSGGGYVDRGATEFVPTPIYTATLTRVRGGGPLDATATVTARFPWTVDGPIGSYAFSAEGKPQVANRTGTLPVTFARAGRSCVDVYGDLDNYRSGYPVYSASPCTMLGAAFTAVTPQRVLNTREGVGVPRTTPLNPHEEIELPLPAPAADSSAVVLNVTVANPTTNGYLKVYPGDQSEPNASNINFAANQTIPNLVTVPVANGRVKIKNGSAGTVNVFADLAGYYGGTGLGLRADSPVRVLDTRYGVGTSASGPLGPMGRVTVDLAGRLPAGTTAVALNVAVTKPTAGGHLTTFPPGGAVPGTSNLNFVTGQTANNMVIAPVVNGKIAFAYGGSGEIHVLADLIGWFAPGIADTYLPRAPRRIIDTRASGYQPIGPGQAIEVWTYDNECLAPSCARTAVVANLTVTGTQSAGYLTVYPSGQPRPAASVINFNANETIANQITVGLRDDSFMIYNSSAKPVHVVVDQAGLYLAPPPA
ncbi:DUF1565 domain-containing protein [Asanoa sp. WMMD1127]|uniref:DUF1565 domain-containing protein n=1 Tax=Asanoa sp. WMMD1127 TaxID=3016107 RepID=UPI002416865B|nr:DUF1565 domain-containing protein [Asanoa sp. WMMD1127]MDG4821765.1 DUF1565 domain-containing protein [Asanoa sp. WMMD1127]